VKKFFLQHDSSSIEVNCLRLTATMHANFALRHDMEYAADYAACSAAPFSANSEGQVWCFKTLHSLPLGSLVLYADADTLVVQPNVDVLELAYVDGCDIMMLGGRHMTGVNSGVMVLRVSEALRAWCDDLLRSGPDREVPYGVNDFIDVKFAKMLKGGSAMKVGWLDDRFNWFARYGEAQRVVLWPEPEAVIKAWHGTEAHKRVTLMKTELNKLKHGIAA